jgi:hypothetical protein
MNQEDEIKQPISLNQQRMETVVAVLKENGLRMHSCRGFRLGRYTATGDLARGGF